MRSMVEGGWWQALNPLHRATRGSPPRTGEDQIPVTQGEVSPLPSGPQRRKPLLSRWKRTPV